MMRRILLVEDNPADVELLCRFLRTASPGTEVVLCRTLKEGIEASGEFDCCLLDLGLPDSEGLETLQQFQQHVDVPVVVLTTLQDLDTGMEAIRLGAGEYLEKGRINPQALRRVLAYTMERGRLRRRLEQVQRSFSSIVERSPNGVVVVQRGRVVFLNKRAREFFNHLEVQDNFPYGFGDHVLSRRILRLVVSPTEWLDSPAELVICTDVTEQRAEDERLRHRESRLHKAQRINALGRLAGGLAHEFNNALTTVTGHAELLRSTQGEQVESQVGPILAAADHMRGLNRQILALSPQPVRELCRVDINQAVTDAKPLLQQGLPEEIGLTCDLGESGWTMFPEGEISRVLLELLANAVQAGAKAITVRTRQVDESVELAVVDDGDGMSELVREQALEPFFSGTGGTGLGLASVYGVVKSAGGSMSLTGSEGEGCCVRVMLPRVEPRQQTERPAHAGTILLVEDDAFVRDLTEQILVRGGHVVHSAACGEDALRVDDEVDLLVTDMVMPGISGAELYRRMAEDRPQLHAVFMSGYSARALPGEAAGRSLFLQKPFRPAALLKAVQKMLPR